MKNHTHKTPPTNLGSSETPTKAIPSNNTETLWEFESKVGQALLAGTNQVETTEEIVKYFLKSKENLDAFKDAGHFIYKNVYVSLKK